MAIEDIMQHSILVLHVQNPLLNITTGLPVLDSLGKQQSGVIGTSQVFGYVEQSSSSENMNDRDTGDTTTNVCLPMQSNGVVLVLNKNDMLQFDGQTWQIVGEPNFVKRAVDDTVHHVECVVRRTTPEPT